MTTDHGKAQLFDAGSVVRSSSDCRPENASFTLDEGRLLIRDIERRLFDQLGETSEPGRDMTV
jgi:hypothetical protein